VNLTIAGQRELEPPASEEFVDVAFFLTRRRRFFRQMLSLPKNPSNSCLVPYLRRVRPSNAPIVVLRYVGD
jgi:hypothetical protein